MDKSFLKTVKAAEKLINENSHEYYARTFLTAVNNNVLKMTKYYGDMQRNHPVKYNNHITSGKMARNIQEAIAADKTTALKVQIIADYGEELERLTQAVKLANRETELGDRELEDSALMLAVDLAKEPKTAKDLKFHILKKANQLTQNTSYDSMSTDRAIDEALKSNYLN